MNEIERVKIEGLIRLFQRDGLPPNIWVHAVPVYENWEGKLQIEQQPWVIQQPISKEECEKLNILETTIELEEFTIENIRYLAGFTQNRLFIGTTKT